MQVHTDIHYLEIRQNIVIAKLIDEKWLQSWTVFWRSVFCPLYGNLRINFSQEITFRERYCAFPYNILDPTFCLSDPTQMYINPSFLDINS